MQAAPTKSQHMEEVTALAHRLVEIVSAQQTHQVGLEALINEKPDVLIAGESDCYGFLYATDAGVPMIETSHDTNECPGVAVFADLLRRQVPLPVHYHENRRCWVWA